MATNHSPHHFPPSLSTHSHPRFYVYHILENLSTAILLQSEANRIRLHALPHRLLSYYQKAILSVFIHEGGMVTEKRHYY